MIAPQVYVRLFSPYNNQPWVPLSATVTSMGPYELGIKLQQTSAEYNRQAVEINLDTSMGSDPQQPFQSYCQLLAGTAGTIDALGGGGILYYSGDGAYGMHASMYTYDQYQVFPGSNCSGGPTSAVTLTVNATATARIEGTPLAPRTTRKARGFVGLGFTTPVGDIGDEWRCAQNPIFAADGSVTGTVVTHDRATSAVDRGVLGTLMMRSAADSFQVAETDAFTRPGLWACVARGLGGKETDSNHFAATPWARTPTITVKGEYERANSRLAVAAHNRMRLTVFTLPSIIAAAARGQLTLTIGRATCVSARKGTFSLHTVVNERARLDTRGHAVLSFRSPSLDGEYLGHLTFRGTSLILPGTDAPMYLAVTAPSHTIQFASPRRGLRAREDEGSITQAPNPSRPGRLLQSSGHFVPRDRAGDEGVARRRATAERSVAIPIAPVVHEPGDRIRGRALARCRWAARSRCR